MDISIRYIELELTPKSAIPTGCTFFVVFCPLLLGAVKEQWGARREQPNTNLIRSWYGLGTEKTQKNSHYFLHYNY